MSLVSINGHLSDGINVGLAPRDRGFLLGDGVFETLLAFNRVALWRREHLDRMHNAALACGIHFQAQVIAASLDEILVRSGAGPHVVRLTLSRGASARGLASDSKESTLVISSDPIDTSLIGKPVALTTSPFRRNGANFSDRHKTLSYLNNIVAARAAVASGCEDALMHSTDGHVACTTIANLFLLKDGHLATPRGDDGVLDGIMRQVLIKQFGAEVRHIDVAELFDADAVFVTNSLRLLRPVLSLDGQLLKTTPVSRYLNVLLNHAQQQCGTHLREIAP
jgi:branched-chain amino acid aminotransferase